MIKIAFYFYIAVCGIQSILSLLFFFIDKKKALQSKKRIKENTLLMSICLGGAIGGIFGMTLFRHKTIFATKWHFYILTVLSLADQIFIFVYFCLQGALL